MHGAWAITAHSIRGVPQYSDNRPFRASSCAQNGVEAVDRVTAQVGQKSVRHLVEQARHRPYGAGLSPACGGLSIGPPGWAYTLKKC
jgi:hypothetical protein